MYAALGKSNSEKAHSTVEILQDTDCVVERTYLCRNVVAQFGFFFKWAFPSLFFFIFVFSIQLTVKCSI